MVSCSPFPGTVGSSMQTTDPVGVSDRGIGGRGAVVRRENSNMVSAIELAPCLPVPRARPRGGGGCTGPVCRRWTRYRERVCEQQMTGVPQPTLLGPQGEIQLCCVLRALVCWADFPNDVCAVLFTGDESSDEQELRDEEYRDALGVAGGGHWGDTHSCRLGSVSWRCWAGRVGGLGDGYCGVAVGLAVDERAHQV